MNIGRSINVALAKRDMKRRDLMSSFGWSPAYTSKICSSQVLGIGTVMECASWHWLLSKPIENQVDAREVHQTRKQLVTAVSDGCVWLFLAVNLCA